MYHLNQHWTKSPYQAPIKNWDSNKDKSSNNTSFPFPHQIHTDYDLLNSVISDLGAKIEKIVIDDLRNHTFFAKIHISLNGQTIKIDSRPSDAMALGAGTNTPIYVAEEVFEKASQ